ncbi:MAG: ABC transporter substrate-binding protein [Proteobacteria bacterium]|nr:ABC transporter substrate-binding protein [Pseudomonadota bacterium]MBS0492371.1 ABC transporter substrate-binding protein [Pseudomonadota bacterium]
MDISQGTEEQQLDHLHREAVKAKESLLVWAGGDAKSQAGMYTAAFGKRFPDVPIEAVVELSKYLDARLDHRLLTGGQVPDVIHLQSLHDYDYWKDAGVLERYRPMGLEQTPQAFVDPDGFFIPLFVFAFSNVYDSRAVDDAEAPIEAPDYLAPKWKGQIVLTYPHDDDAVLYQFDQVVAQFGWKWLHALLEQDVKWARGTQTPAHLIATGKKKVSFTTYNTLVDQPGNPLRFRIPERTYFQSWYQTGAIVSSAKNKWAARLYLSFWLSQSQQQNVFQWPAREDIALPAGFRHVRHYPNTSPHGFREFMRDRARVERLRGIYENFIGPIEGPNPNTLDL